MGIAAANVAACGGGGAEAPDVPVFTTVEQCLESGDYAKEDCEGGLQFALSQQYSESPRFQSQASCETQYGPSQCHTYNRGDGTSIWMPLLGGYMLGQALSGGHPGYHSYNYGGYWRSYEPGRPVRQSYSTPNNLPRPKSATIPKPTVAHTRAITRGGFGGRAGGYSSGG